MLSEVSVLTLAGCGVIGILFPQSCEWNNTVIGASICYMLYIGFVSSIRIFVLENEVIFIPFFMVGSTVSVVIAASTSCHQSPFFLILICSSLYGCCATFVVTYSHICDFPIEIGKKGWFNWMFIILDLSPFIILGGIQLFNSFPIETWTILYIVCGSRMLILSLFMFSSYNSNWIIELGFLISILCLSVYQLAMVPKFVDNNDVFLLLSSLIWGIIGVLQCILLFLNIYLRSYTIQ